MAIPKPKLLIGSSSEGLPYAEELQRRLKPSVESLIWNQDFFQPNKFALESLEARSREFDGSVIVATADDRVVSRGKTSKAPRDNLLFEFGMFLAVFGRERALLVVEGLGETKLPSDLGGLTVIPLEKTVPIASGVGPVAITIREVAKGWRNSLISPELAGRLDHVLRINLQDIQAVSSVAAELGLHLFLVDKRSSPETLERVARARSNPKSARTWSPFKKGNGVVGTCWERGESVWVDLTTPKYASATESKWKRIKSEDRFGMSFDMLKTSRSRYKSVVSVPITVGHGREFIGCVSMNLGLSSPWPPAALRSEAVDRVLDRCTEIIAIVLGY